MRNFVFGTALALCLSVGAVAQQTFEYARSATQAGAQSLSLDLYSGGRGCSAPRPTVLYAHGGGFKGGNRDAAKRKGIAQSFTKAGINVVSMSYRLAGDRPVLSAPFQAMYDRAGDVSASENYPGQAYAGVAAMEDMVKALTYITNNADRMCIDRREIFLMGTSAGAVTALNVGYNLDEAGIRRPSIEGVLDFWGGGMPATSISAGNIPLFIGHGERDRVVPFAYAESYWNRATAVGVPIQLHSFRNIEHGFDLRRTRVNGTSVMELAIRFVKDISEGRRPETVRTRN